MLERRELCITRSKGNRKIWFTHAECSRVINISPRELYGRRIWVLRSYSFVYKATEWFGGRNLHATTKTIHAWPTRRNCPCIFWWGHRDSNSAGDDSRGIKVRKIYSNWSQIKVREKRTGTSCRIRNLELLNLGMERHFDLSHAISNKKFWVLHVDVISNCDIRMLRCQILCKESLNLEFKRLMVNKLADINQVWVYEERNR